MKLTLWMKILNWMLKPYLEWYLKEYANRNFRYAKAINKAISIRLEKPGETKLDIDAENLVILGNVAAGSNITVRPNLNLKMNIEDVTKPYDIDAR